MATRRRPLGFKRIQEDAGCFVRLNGRDYLQYAGEPCFKADEGELGLRFRIHEAPDNMIDIGRWHEAVIRWGGFNRPEANPFIEIEASPQPLRSHYEVIRAVPIGTLYIGVAPKESSTPTGVPKDLAASQARHALAELFNWMGIKPVR